MVRPEVKLSDIKEGEAYQNKEGVVRNILSISPDHMVVYLENGEQAQCSRWDFVTWATRRYVDEPQAKKLEPKQASSENDV